MFSNLTSFRCVVYSCWKFLELKVYHAWKLLRLITHCGALAAEKEGENHLKFLGLLTSDILARWIITQEYLEVRGMFTMN